MIASRLDNSPYTVYECLENAIPFIATDVGGVAELIHEEDRPRVLVSGDPAEIAERLIEAFENGVAPARLSFDPSVADIDLLSLHGNLVAEARSLRGRMPEPTRPASIIVHGSAHAVSRGSLAQWLARAKDLGAEVLRSANSDTATLNRLARSAAHDHLLFCHAAVLPDPEALAAMLTAMEATGAEAVVCGYRRPSAEDGQESVAVFAGPPELSSQENVYGARLFLVRKDSFVDAGGFSGEAGVADILEWELLNRMKASGRRVIGVPTPLAASDGPPQAGELTAMQRGQLAAAWTEAAPPHLHGFVRMALNRETRAFRATQPSQVETSHVPKLGLSDLIALRAAQANDLGGASISSAAAPPTGQLRIKTPSRKPEAEAVTGSGSRLWAADSLLEAIAPMGDGDSRQGALRIGPDGRLRDHFETYTVRSESDAADCDFLVVDGLLDAQQLSLLSSIFDEAEKNVLANGHDAIRGTSFLWLSELALTHPEVVGPIREIVARGVALTAEFYDLTAPLSPDLVRLEKVRRGMAIMPRAQSMGIQADESDPFGFSGFLFVDAAPRGGALYFTGLDMAVEPRSGRFVAATSSPHHERAVLTVEDGNLLALSFSMRFANVAAQPDLGESPGIRV